MSARVTAGLTAAAAIMLAFLVSKVMAWNVAAGTLLACVLTGAAALCAYWLLGTGKGQHVAPRGWAEADERPALPCERETIPRAQTEHDPPWEGEHITEPTAIMPAPVPEPEPEAFFIAAGTVSDGRVTSVHVAVLPPVVQKELGHQTVDAWLESAFTRAMALQVLELTDGAP